MHSWPSFYRTRTAHHTKPYHTTSPGCSTIPSDYHYPCIWRVVKAEPINEERVRWADRRQIWSHHRHHKPTYNLGEKVQISISTFLVVKSEEKYFFSGTSHLSFQLTDRLEGLCVCKPASLNTGSRQRHTRGKLLLSAEFDGNIWWGTRRWRESRISWVFGDLDFVDLWIWICRFGFSQALTKRKREYKERSERYQRWCGDG